MLSNVPTCPGSRGPPNSGARIQTEWPFLPRVVPEAGNAATEFPWAANAARISADSDLPGTTKSFPSQPSQRSEVVSEAPTVERALCDVDA